MPFPEVKMEVTRMQFAVRAASGAESLSELCRQFGVSRPTGRKWRDRYLECGRLSEVRELSRRPHHSPRRSSPELEAQVIALRLRYGWGAGKLRELLLQAKIDCPVQTVHRILQRHGLVNPHAARPGCCRFERERPNQLWQMDGKGPLRSRDGSCQPLSILDDHSRYAIGLYPLQHLRRESIQACLEQAFEEAGVPEEMLMDRGAQWFSAHSDHGLTALSVWLIKQGIQLIHGRPRHPQTQGKVERFHGTIEAAIRHRGAPELMAGWEDWLAEFRIEYNEVRPHEALGMQTPAQNWSRSERRFERSPAEWEYPTGAEVRRLNEAGCLAEGGATLVCVRGAGGRAGGAEEAAVGDDRGAISGHVHPGVGPSAADDAAAGQACSGGWIGRGSWSPYGLPRPRPIHRNIADGTPLGTSFKNVGVETLSCVHLETLSGDLTQKSAQHRTMLGNFYVFMQEVPVR